MCTFIGALRQADADEMRATIAAVEALRDDSRATRTTLWWMRARKAEKAGGLHEAVDAYRRALKQDRGNQGYPLRRNLASLLQQLGDLDGAREVWWSGVNVRSRRGPQEAADMLHHLARYGPGDVARWWVEYRACVQALGGEPPPEGEEPLPDARRRLKEAQGLYSAAFAERDRRRARRREQYAKRTRGS